MKRAAATRSGLRSSAAALAWELHRPHRWGLSAVTAYLTGLALYRFATLRAPSSAFDDERALSFAVVVPLAASFLFLLSIYSFGLQGDLAARRSIFPARLFTLPVTSGFLAGVPMVCGIAATATVWIVARLAVEWPQSLDMPWLWPGLLASAILAWTQALTWMSYPLAWMRVAVVVLLMVGLDAVVILALHFRAGEAWMTALLAPQLPLAYLVARSAVARARRGDLPGPSGRRVRPFRPSSYGLPLVGGALATSPAAAQAWFEWRQFGRSLPVLVALVLPFELSLLFVLGASAEVVLWTLFVVLLTPAFLAAFVSLTIARAEHRGSSAWSLSPFTASRPVTSSFLVGARLRAAVRSVAVTWMLVLALTPPAVMLSGTHEHLLHVGERLAEVFGPVRASGLAALALALGVGLTWQQLVQSLVVGMSGRARLVRGYVLLALGLLTGLVLSTQWVLGSRARVAALVDAIPALLVAAVAFKILLASWLVIRLHRDRLVRPRRLLAILASWDVAVLLLFLALRWLTPVVLLPGALLVLAAILALPLVRPLATPLALSWNRHR